METKVIQLIRELLFNTLKIDFHYIITESSESLELLDRGLRKGLLNSEHLYQELSAILRELSPNIIYIFTDNYLLKYIFFRPNEKDSGIMSFGPYISTPMDTNFYNEIAQKNHLSFSQVNSLKDYMYQIPLQDNNMQLLSIIQVILGYMNTSITDYKIQEIDGESQKRDIENYVPIEDFETYVSTIEHRYQIEEQIFQAVFAGNQGEALAANRQFLNCLFEPRIENVLQEKKYMLNTVNTLCRKAAQKRMVHPVFLHQLSSQHSKQIDLLVDFSQIDWYCEKIISSYCHLIQNKSRGQYSPVIRNVINYIELNLNQNMTLSFLAKHFNISASYLSALFKKETDSTLTDYIIEQRLHTAIGLLNTTTMQIQDVANYVGINDINYFSRLFKRRYGCSPSQYRKKLAT